MIVKSKHNSCHGCKYYFMKECKWFNPAKEIPKEILEKGCKFQSPKIPEIEVPGIIAEIINKFNGEFIYTHEYKNTYKRKYYKSKNKYGERKDW